jgi:hypothetical protein
MLAGCYCRRGLRYWYLSLLFTLCCRHQRWIDGLRSGFGSGDELFIGPNRRSRRLQFGRLGCL